MVTDPLKPLTHYGYTIISSYPNNILEITVGVPLRSSLSPVQYLYLRLIAITPNAICILYMFIYVYYLAQKVTISTCADLFMASTNRQKYIFLTRELI